MRFEKLLINNVEKTQLDMVDFAVFHVRLPLDSLNDVTFHLNDSTLEWHEISRPDLPKGTYWFAVYADLTSLHLFFENQFCLRIRGEDFAKEKLLVTESEIDRLRVVRKDILQKRKKLKAITLTKKIQKGKIFSIDQSRHNPALSLKSDKVSTHAYAPKLMSILRDLPADALVLDVGAGFRFRHHPQIVTLEIFDYPSTDVISFGDNIPFETASFDCIYTNAVLEHVENPFAVAREIGRVLKPGGVLYSSIPFLQVEHGYPFHYFNATRAGHRKLFEDDFDIQSVTVGPAGHPWHIIMRSLGLLRSGIPGDRRDDFNKLTVGEILNGSYRYWVESQFGECSEEIMWRLAGSTVISAKRKTD